MEDNIIQNIVAIGRDGWEVVEFPAEIIMFLEVGQVIYYHDYTYFPVLYGVYRKRESDGVYEYTKNLSLLPPVVKDFFKESVSYLQEELNRA